MDGHSRQPRSARADARGVRGCVLDARHHPYSRTGIPAMDANNLRSGAALIARLEVHPKPVRMLSCHVHRAVTGKVGRVTCRIAPASCHAVLTHHRSGPDPQLVLEPGAGTAHRWLDQPGAGLVSDVIHTGMFPGP